MKGFDQMPLDELLRAGGHKCECGRIHKAGLKWCRIERNAVRLLPDALSLCGISKPFFVCDANTKTAVWGKVSSVLDKAGISYVMYEFPMKSVEPDEYAVGSLLMAFDPSCDGIVAVGSGVINDCCKVLAHAVGKPNAVVCTAPSMDGYASNSSSMIRDHVKVSLFNQCPTAIVADTEIMAQAPMRMLWAGLGDMLAKYVSICEWRISNMITGEYFCPNIAGLVRESLRRLVEAAPKLCDRDPDTVGAITEGLVLSGVAMAFAEISRPASGLEHYFSHIWEMIALDRGMHSDLHGIQVGVGTLLTMRILDRLRNMRPDIDRMNKFSEEFDPERWESETRRVFGKAAQTVLDTAAREHKNDNSARLKRAKLTIDNYDEIMRIVNEELPPTAEVERLMKLVGMPMKPSDIGVSDSDTIDALHASRDIRNKYLTSTMLWDLGLLYDFPIDIEPSKTIK